MRITKPVNIRALCKPTREIANIGCTVCPCCGENKSVFDWVTGDVCNRGIMGGIQKDFIVNANTDIDTKVDAYLCYTCGAEWESDPYRQE